MGGGGGDNDPQCEPGPVLGRREGGRERERERERERDRDRDRDRDRETETERQRQRQRFKRIKDFRPPKRGVDPFEY